MTTEYGQSLIAEKDGDSVLKVSYTNGLNEVISRTEYGGETPNTVFFLYDANCSVNAIVNEAGELVKTFDYEEFGGPHPSPNVAQSTNNQNAEDNQFRFAGGVGHLTDESGLVYMRARYYDPLSGRFISEDPGRNGTNWYAYCGNNPVNAVDLTGRAPVLPTGMAVSAQIIALLNFLSLAHSGAEAEAVENAYNNLMDLMEATGDMLGGLDILSVAALALEIDEGYATLGMSAGLDYLAMLGSAGIEMAIYTEAWAAREEFYEDMIDRDDY